MRDQNKLRFFFYELVGTMFLTWGYNMTKNPGTLIFIMSVINWEISCAHFNNAISLGTLVFNHKDFLNNLVPYIILTFV